MKGGADSKRIHFGKPSCVPSVGTEVSVGREMGVGRLTTWFANNVFLTVDIEVDLCNLSHPLPVE